MESGNNSENDRQRIDEQVDRELLLAQIRVWLDFYDRNIKPIDQTGIIG